MVAQVQAETFFIVLILFISECLKSKTSLKPCCQDVGFNFLIFTCLSDLNEDSGMKTKLFPPNNEQKSSSFPSLPPIGTALYTD